jgi:Anti-sigma factor NepR
MIVAPTTEPQAANVAARDPKAAEAIGRALKAHYAELVEAPLPEKFLELLARFKARDRVPELNGPGDAIG